MDVGRPRRVVRCGRRKSASARASEAGWKVVVDFGLLLVKGVGFIFSRCGDRYPGSCVVGGWCDVEAMVSNDEVGP